MSSFQHMFETHLQYLSISLWVKLRQKQKKNVFQNENMQHEIQAELCEFPFFGLENNSGSGLK